MGLWVIYAGLNVSCGRRPSAGSSDIPELVGGICCANGTNEVTSIRIANRPRRSCDSFDLSFIIVSHAPS